MSRTGWTGVAAALVSAACATLVPLPVCAQATGWSDKQLAKRLAAYEKLTPADFSRAVTIQDDELEPIATLATDRGHVFKGGFTDTVRADAFLRALVSKASGTTVFQLYAKLTYSGEYRQFTSVNFALASGPQSVPASVEHHEVQCPYGTCVREDDVAFIIPEAVVREIAAGAEQTPLRPFRFRLKSRTGEDWTDDMSPAEAAGLLLAVDAFKAKAKR